MARQYTIFQSPFKNTAQVQGLAGRYLEQKSKISDKQVLKAGQRLRQSNDIQEIRGNIRIVYRWKLQSFYDRFSWVRSFPNGVQDDLLITAISIARDARPEDEESVRAALGALVTIRGVGVPVASAILTAMHPNRFTVTDRQAYKSLGTPFCSGISEYINYLEFCRRECSRLDVSLREHDRALWQYGAELGRRRN